MAESVGPGRCAPARPCIADKWVPDPRRAGRAEENVMGRGGKFFFDKVYTVTEILAGIAFGVLCIAVGIQVASRYLFEVSFGWAEEFPLFVFLWVCFMAAAAAYRQNSHLGVSLLFDRLPRGFRKVARYLELLLTLALFPGHFLL